EMCANKNGVAPREIARNYDVAPKTAWFMTNRLREAIRSLAPERLVSGVVMAGEKKMDLDESVNVDMHPDDALRILLGAERDESHGVLEPKPDATRVARGVDRKRRVPALRPRGAHAWVRQVRTLRVPAGLLRPYDVLDNPSENEGRRSS